LLYPSSTARSSPGEEVHMKHLPTWVWIAGAAFTIGAMLATLF
jgi:hypothetical protein